MKIAFFDAKSYDVAAFEAHGAKKGVTYKFFETKLSEDTAPLARGYDGVCVFVNDSVNAAVIDTLAYLGVRLIALRCAGFNNVDLRRAAEKNLRVVRVPAYSPYAVAEHAMAMLLTAVRNTHKAYIRTKSFNFSLTGLTGFDLHGKTVGVIGTGKIGRVFIDLCRGFGMKVIAYDKYPVTDADIHYVTPETLFAQSDVISLHCPLTDETHHMIDSQTIGMMKEGVVLVNTSRGALIDAEALVDAIKAGRIGTACLDVYEEESDFFFEDFSEHVVMDDTLARLISMPNVLVTSHQAFLTAEALDNIAETTTENIHAFFKDKTCKNEVLFQG